VKAPEIVFREATKRYAGRARPALDRLSLRVPPGEVCVLVGPSGAGKTTAMKLVNRLLELDGGDVLVGGRSVRGLDATALRRGMGYVIQQGGLFPHVTVAANVGTVPKLLRWERRRTAARVEELLELVGLEPAVYGRQYPSQLSGGERQRVGLARALAADPGVLLMDEPFGALDPITRVRLQDEFLAMQQEVQKTVVFVTHDVDEAVKVGDRIAVLREGGVLARYAPPDELLARPGDEFVERFVGADRGLKRLALRRLADVGLDGGELLRPGDPELPAETSLRDAVSIMLAEGRSRCGVSDDGRVVGSLSLERLAAVLSDDGVPAP
jgi:osmoprotectant transport system ATP-binding protein